MSRSSNKIGNQNGFSLTELLVTLSIVGVLMGVVLGSQSTYTEDIALSNLADEIGLSIAQAQAYGIGVRELTPGSEDFSIAYGLTVSLLSGGSNSAYLTFADRDGDQSYDGDWACATGGANECLEKKTMTRGNYIQEICAIRTSGTDQCSNIGRVDISFVRPLTEAQLIFYNTSGSLYEPPNLKGARITLKSPGNKNRSVIVYGSGQISVQ